MKFLVLAAAIAAADMCKLPFDVVILQDTTGSFVDDLPNVQAALPPLMKSILVQNPNTHFAIADFKDKPYHDLGFSGNDALPADHCYKLWSPLTDDLKAAEAAYNNLYASGGGDLPESQLQALINIVQDKSLAWRPVEGAGSFAAGTDSTVSGGRLIIMSTDATYHDPLDYQFYNGEYDDGFGLPEPPLPPVGMTAYPDDPSGLSFDDQCMVYAYPSGEQAAKILKDSGIMLVTLVPADMTDSVDMWKDFNRMLGQPDSFVQYISSDSSDLSEVVLKAMGNVSEYVCSTATTPTPEETTKTTATTTGAATTKPSTATTKPTTGTTKPTTGTTKPATGTTVPATGTTSSGDSGECGCNNGGGDCACPEVVIKLRHRPQILHFDMSNEI